MLHGPTEHRPCFLSRRRRTLRLRPLRELRAARSAISNRALPHEPLQGPFLRPRRRYREARPPYPDALFDWLAQQAPGTRSPGTPAAATVRPASRSPRVSRACSRPIRAPTRSPRRKRAEHRISRRAGERCRSAVASADLVTVAQALHWFDHRAFAEVKRVLRPGGVLAAWAYSDCRPRRAVDVSRIASTSISPARTGRRSASTSMRATQTIPFPSSEIARRRSSWRRAGRSRSFSPTCVRGRRRSATSRRTASIRSRSSSRIFAPPGAIPSGAATCAGFLVRAAGP